MYKPVLDQKCPKCDFLTLESNGRHTRCANMAFGDGCPFGWPIKKPMKCFHPSRDVLTFGVGDVSKKKVELPVKKKVDKSAETEQYKKLSSIRKAGRKSATHDPNSVAGLAGLVNIGGINP